MHDCVIQVVRLLLNIAGLKINYKNLRGCDIWQVQRPISSEMRCVLRRARLLSRVFPDRRAINTHEVYLKSNPIGCFRLFMLRLQMKIPNELRSILFVVAVLYLTLNFELVLNPPGGLWQDNCDPQHNPVGCTAPHQAGKVIMDEQNFIPIYFYCNLSSFLATLCLLIVLLPWNNRLSFLFLIPLILLFACYLLSLQIVIPSSFKISWLPLWYGSLSVLLLLFIIVFFFETYDQ